MSDSGILWTVAHQAPLSMGFSRQEYWRGLPFPSPGDLSNPEIELLSSVAPELQAEALPMSHRESSSQLESSSHQPLSFMSCSPSLSQPGVNPLTDKLASPFWLGTEEKGSDLPKVT